MAEADSRAEYPHVKPLERINKDGGLLGITLEL